ncbi:hypothetical protein SDC9_192342 [bioreactor metagenome]|uniref:Spore cortex biosynthesis protein YabQ n=1 Tax=bioreactor metagenome TaxID=1076179 RepID=A0A645I0H7_9ZZZZ
MTAFLQMLYVGALIGLFYDITQYALIAVFKNNIIWDLVFWTAATAAILSAMFRATDLSVRLYLICGIIVGWALYYLTISPLFRKIFDLLAEKISKRAAKSLTAARADYNRFLVKNKRTIGKINLTVKKLFAIPLSVKKRYNTYIKYFSRFKGSENGKQRKKKKEN